MKHNIALISLARRGGLVHYNAELANALAEFASITAITAKAIPDGYLGSKVNHLCLDTGIGAWGTMVNAVNPGIYHKIAKIIRDNEIDLIHITGSHEWNPIIGLHLKLLVRKPFVYTIHDPKHHEGVSLYLKIPENLIRKIPDGIIVHTNSGKDHLSRQKIFNGPIRTIPMGIFSMFNKISTDEIIEENEILFFGRIEPYKGLDVLLSSAPIIFKTLPDWRMVIAGSGSLGPYQNLIKDKRITVINRYISDEEVQQLMGRAKIIALPYKSATQSGIVPIAYAMGKPVVATNVGGLPDVVIHEKTGLIIPPNDKNALADAVIRLAKDEVFRQQLGRNAYKMGQTDMSWRKIAKKHLAFYKVFLNT